MKDLRLFLRNTSQWFQFCILPALVIVYLNGVRTTSEEASDTFWQNLALVISLALTGFVISAISVRFFYPQLGQEGRAYWLLRSAPISPGKVFRSKFTTGLVVNFLVGQALTWVSLFFLRPEMALVVLCAIAALFFSLALTGLAYGMGAVFPGFRTENPAEIASEMGGILTLVLSIVLVGAVVVFLAAPLRETLKTEIDWDLFRHPWTRFFILAGTGFSFLTALAGFFVGRTAFSRRET